MEIWEGGRKEGRKEGVGWAWGLKVKDGSIERL